MSKYIIIFVIEKYGIIFFKLLKCIRLKHSFGRTFRPFEVLIWLVFFRYYTIRVIFIIFVSRWGSCCLRLYLSLNLDKVRWGCLLLNSWIIFKPLQDILSLIIYISLVKIFILRILYKELWVNLLERGPCPLVIF